MAGTSWRPLCFLVFIGMSWIPTGPAHAAECWQSRCFEHSYRSGATAVEWTITGRKGALKQARGWIATTFPNGGGESKPFTAWSSSPERGIELLHLTLQIPGNPLLVAVIYLSGNPYGFLKILELFDGAKVSRNQIAHPPIDSQHTYYRSRG